MLAGKPVKGFLLDITGVLYNSSHGDGEAIRGSIAAVKRLYNESKVRFLSNESSATTEKFVAKLRRLGFELKTEDVITPAPVVAQYLHQNGFRPHLLVHDDVKDEFATCDTRDPNCVVIGDAEDNFTYSNLNAAFRLLHRRPDVPLICMGNNKFYQRTDGPSLDVGCFAAALRFATDCRQIEMGKPSKEYFQRALNSIQLPAEACVMIGDDIVGDVGGSQAMGMRGVQVKTGKWLPEWEKHGTVTPDLIANDLLHAVSTILDATN